MSAQMIELLIFAGIAFFIINKLIATLGSTSNNDPTKQHSSYFGENTLKDVTSTAKTSNSVFTKHSSINAHDPKELIVEENLDSIVSGLKILHDRMKSFSISNFIRSSKMAFKMIVESGNNKNETELEKLVDKRYLEQFQSIATDYGTCINLSNLEAKISEIYMFGHNVFIKILFTGENVTNQMKNIEEEWTFNKSLITNNINWFLTNINRL